MKIHTLGYFEFQTGIGGIALTWDQDDLLTGIHWISPQVLQTRAHDQIRCAPVPLRLWNLINQLVAYFACGEPITLSPWEFLGRNRGWSEFQARTYRVAATVPHGETRTYGWLAAKIGIPCASRAVGQALSRNDFPILIPCHRIVQAHRIGGFMGESDLNAPPLQFKKWLIGVEESFRNPMLPCM